MTGADGRRPLLHAALGVALVSLDTPRDRAARGPLRASLAWWRGIGDIARGMARQGHDLALARYGDLGWRATFYVTGREHSPIAATASAFEPTAARTAQVVACAALVKDRTTQELSGVASS